MSLLLLPNASLWNVKIQAHFSKHKSIGDAANLLI